MKEHFERNGWDYPFTKLEMAKKPKSRFPMVKMFRLAFWALFRYHENVLSRAEEMKLNAGLALPSQQDQRGASSDGSTVKPYIALHHRMSDYFMTKNVQGNNLDFKDKAISRRTDDQRLLDCFVRVQERVDPTGRMLGYLAGDNVQIRQKLNRSVDTLRFPPELDIFHVDKSAKYRSEIYRGTLDAWAEQVVLIDSQCLIMSWSMYSFCAYYIRGGQHRCAIFVDDCNQTDLTLEWNNYWFEPGKPPRLQKRLS